MSLVGNLEDLALTDILQIVSLSRKSGILGLKRDDVQAKVFFRDGNVIAAKVSDFPLDLGSFLARKGLLTPADQVHVRERVRKGESVREVLTNDFGVPEKVLDGFGRAGIEKAVYRLFTWSEGAFHFDLRESEDVQAEIEPFIPSHPVGVNPQFLAMEGARIKDESDYFTNRDGAPSAPSSPSDLPLDSRQPFDSPAKGEAFSTHEQAEPGAGLAPEASDSASNAVAEAVERREPEPQAESASSKDNPVIVLIDNDAVALRNVERELSRKGYPVAAFNRVEAAVKAAREQLSRGRSLIMLADLVMPKRDGSGMLGGLEVLEIMRGEEQDVPVIIMADLQNLEAEARAKELSVDFYVEKPGRKCYVKEGENQVPEFRSFVGGLLKGIGGLREKAAKLSASRTADPFVDLSTELKGELEAATSAVSAGAPVGQAPAMEKSRGLNVLKEMVRELNDPQFSADVSLLVLRFTVELMSRAVLFIRTNDQVIGLGQAGVDRADASNLVRATRIPLNEPSIFADVIKLQSSVRRQLDSGKWNRYLLENLGGAAPTESFAAPIFTSRRLAAIVYGDNAGEGKPIGDTDALEIFLSHAGAAMERALLERRIRDLTAGQRINYSD